MFKGFLALLAFTTAVSAIRAEVICKRFTIPQGKLCELSSHGSKPTCPEEINVAYVLYQRDTKPIVISRDNIIEVVLNKNKTIFVVHGFRTDLKTPWVPDMKDKLLGKSDVNVILVDWHKGADQLPIYYQKAARNVQTVGYDIAGIMDGLEAKGVQYSSMWCIGHSLGAHTCGHAGRNIKNYGVNRIGRITGLDPAGPEFHTDSDPCSLKKDDADFVDVIHTHGGNRDSVKFGKLAPMGTLDFYPNTGRKQPECGLLSNQNIISVLNTEEKFPENVEKWVSCSHERVYVYFINSINEKACSFKATQQCTDYEKIPDSCIETNDPAQMGYHADPSHKGLYYLDVVPLGPECYTENGVGNKTPSVYLLVLVAISITRIIVA